MLKKFLLSFFAFWVFAMSFLPSVSYAQSQNGTWYNQSFQEWYKKVNDSPSDEIFGERYTAAQVQWVIYGLFYFILNSSSNGNGEAFSCVMSKDIKDCTKSINNLLPKNSILSQETNTSFLSELFADRSFSGITYIKNNLADMKIIPSAHAQQTGFGFKALDPALTFWKNFRDMSYALFVFVIIAFAFMIMFRVKISPQAVISVQSALPKIAITLILVTFSYAIAGLLVDLMYLVIALISLFFNYGLFGGDRPLAVFGMLTSGIAGTGIFGLLSIYIWMFLLTLIAVILGNNGIFSLVFASIFPGYAIGAIGFGIIITLLLAIVLFIAAIKIVWVLLKTYANIILYTMFAPLIISLGMISPSVGFGSWIKGMVANLAVFPTVGVLWSISMYFLIGGLATVLTTIKNQISFSWIKDFNLSSVITSDGWPPLLSGVGNTNNPAGGDPFMAFLYIIVSLVILLMIPKVVQIIQGIMSGKGFEYGTAIGEAVGPVAKPIVGFAGPVINQGRAGLTLKGVQVAAEKLKFDQSSFYKESILPGLQKQAGIETKKG